ncbi:hypothetical protein BC830DRAFT_1234695 [Chytriomyces sp. MP71]|nr:hypothetical protein BC830DRAFT_1234695 [Chytriomyces sp. MP71]
MATLKRYFPFAKKKGVNVIPELTDTTATAMEEFLANKRKNYIWLANKFASCVTKKDCPTPDDCGSPDVLRDLFKAGVEIIAPGINTYVAAKHQRFVESQYSMDMKTIVKELGASDRTFLGSWSLERPDLIIAAVSVAACTCVAAVLYVYWDDPIGSPRTHERNKTAQRFGGQLPIVGDAFTILSWSKRFHEKRLGTFCV